MMAREIKAEDNIHVNTGIQLSRTSQEPSNMSEANMGTREQRFSILCEDLIPGGFHVIIHQSNKMTRLILTTDEEMEAHSGDMSRLRWHRKHPKLAVVTVIQMTSTPLSGGVLSSVVPKGPLGNPTPHDFRGGLMSR